MNEAAVEILESYIYEMFPPAITWPKYYFEKRVYSRWAANEILERMKKETDTNPIEVIHKFANQMDEYYELSNKTMFQIAYDTAWEIMDLFLF